jgi:hypothetical protein
VRVQRAAIASSRTTSRLAKPCSGIGEWVSGRYSYVTTVTSRRRRHLMTRHLSQPVGSGSRSVGTTAGGLNDQVIQQICRCVYAFIRDAGQRRRIDLLVPTTQAADLLLNRGLRRPLARFPSRSGYTSASGRPCAQRPRPPVRSTTPSGSARARPRARTSVRRSASRAVRTRGDDQRVARAGSRNQGGVEPPLARDPLQLRDAPVLEGKS